jgi:hypothetical protein
MPMRAHSNLLFVFFALAGLAEAAPLSFEELSLLVRMKENPNFIVSELTTRRMVRALNFQQEQTLRAQGISDTLLATVRNPAFLLSDAEVAAWEKQQEQQRQRAAARARPAAPAAVVPKVVSPPAPGAGALFTDPELGVLPPLPDMTKPAAPELNLPVADPLPAPVPGVRKEDFQLFDHPIDKTVNLNQWGGPNQEIQFKVERRFNGAPDDVEAVLTNHVRPLAEAAPNKLPLTAAPQKKLTINRNNPVVVPEMATLYPVYESGGVSLYFAYVSVTKADAVTLAVKVTKRR